MTERIKYLKTIIDKGTDENRAYADIVESDYVGVKDLEEAERKVRYLTAFAERIG